MSYITYVPQFSGATQRSQLLLVWRYPDYVHYDFRHREIRQILCFNKRI